ncbi:MAG: thioredoxin domain-containing protein [Candidatus Nanohaloarchaea archaeon]|nr:thioredoxin domain-containing protein [Candidatus Nanohaloarchaea archaeon]
MELAGREVPLHLLVSAAVLLIVAGLVVTSPRLTEKERPDDGMNAGVLRDGTDPVLGNRSADLVLFYWGDYQCPFCARFERNTFHELRTSFIETGELLFVKKNFPNVAGAKSDYAALAAGCVQRLGNASTYWEWHTAMYKRENFDTLQRTRRDVRGTVVGLTSNLTGLSAANISRCMDRQHDAIMDEVQNDIGEARSHGIVTTPGFILFNRATNETSMISGAHPFSFFRDRIRQLRGDGG